jgi:hypothetical protein
MKLGDVSQNLFSKSEVGSQNLNTSDKKCQIPNGVIDSFSKQELPELTPKEINMKSISNTDS